VNIGNQHLNEDGNIQFSRVANGSRRCGKQVFVAFISIFRARQFLVPGNRFAFAIPPPRNCSGNFLESPFHFRKILYVALVSDGPDSVAIARHANLLSCSATGSPPPKIRWIVGQLDGTGSEHDAPKLNICDTAQARRLMENSAIDKSDTEFAIRCVAKRGGVMAEGNMSFSVSPPNDMASLVRSWCMQSISTVIYDGKS
jgi:hypothetical protein